MNGLNWKDGGNKPLSYAEDCAICGEKIMVPTRDYYYAYDENKKAVRAHAACAVKALTAAVSSGPSPEVMDQLIDELMMIREALAQINEAIRAHTQANVPVYNAAGIIAGNLAEIARQGAK